MKGAEYLTKPQQYALVYRQGSSVASDLVVLKSSPNRLAFSRCGFSVSKRVGKAVTRNRLKRLLREILRITALKPGWDMVFIVRPAAATADYATLKGKVEGLLSRAHLLATAQECGFPIHPDISERAEVKAGKGGLAV